MNGLVFNPRLLSEDLARRRRDTAQLEMALGRGTLEALGRGGLWARSAARPSQPGGFCRLWSYILGNARGMWAKSRE